MDVSLYLMKRRGEVRMTGVDEIPGIRYTGPVLNGEAVVERAVRESGLPVTGQLAYRRLQDYDAVLRAHCRLPRG